ELALRDKDLKSSQEDLARVQGRLDAAVRKLEELERANRGLSDTVVRVRAEAENRFAGIELTGSNVVFLVDMSGSMELIDAWPEARQRWQEVARPFAGLLRPPPNLRRFRVIVFSDTPALPFGTDLQWMDYDARTSADQVQKRLLEIKPKGGTNVYAA